MWCSLETPLDSRNGQFGQRWTGILQVLDGCRCPVAAQIFLKSFFFCAVRWMKANCVKLFVQARTGAQQLTRSEGNPPTPRARKVWDRPPNNPCPKATKGRPELCRLPFAHLGNPSTTTSSLLVSNWSTTPRSRSRTKTLVRTLPPAAAAFSRGNPLRPNVPTTAHANL